ncbi:tRNA threonylcarbamoyl adenosine modification protein YeaZ [Leucobacter komagatae]|uniref:tRNA threonylcarbamoyl adenosine modification protein YeaZ n=1 Tax=Leucobacter komagatae TaxID=55969 RepID=A0A542XXQ2_9MICO|nr:tRNA (adenosine(37)-N6)-threonylcarbamoyltransferase complex dimerization subunit type 1 TsaB [Leucobacter komagatae]TQL40612.1 tRNA threonylcarbamoyl adenosine modification protein YeaZ [Leucobacter komagatae]
MTSFDVRTVSAPELGERVILAIDTSLGTSVAVGAGGSVVEVSSDDPRGHAEVVGALIDRALSERGILAAAVTDVVAGMGPGPFTGLRVGIVAAHAFALGRGQSVLPLVSHDAVALETLEAGATAGVRVVQDAKRRELFVTDYASLDWAGCPERAAEPGLVAREGYEAVPNEVWPERVPAAALVRLAARRLAAGRAFEPDQALYLRLPDVMQPKAPKPVTP